MMNLSAKGAAFITYEEGFVAKYYLDPVKVGTIGIGFTWASKAFQTWWNKNKPGVKFGPGATMTRSEAESALIKIINEEYGKEVNKFLGKTVPQHVFDAMCSMVYNCGPGALKWKWAAAAKSGDYKTAASLLSTTATTAQGVKLPGLVRRRKEESALLEKGVYAGVAKIVETKTTSTDAMADGILVRGERGPAVAQLIKDLASLGYYTGKLDDIFGYGTEAAVLAFQRAHGLKSDGYAGPKTLQAIKSALGATNATKPKTNWLSALIAALTSFLKRG